MWNDAAVVSILKRTASPTFTLICVAKPWIVGSPAPSTSHVDCGVPDKQFSATTEFAGDAHGPVAAPATWGAAARPNEAHRTAATAAILRRLPPAGGPAPNQRGVSPGWVASGALMET